MTTLQEKKAKIKLIEKKLIENGLRLTRLRRIILEVLIHETRYLSVAKIHQLACKNQSDFAVASVYRNINVMVSIGVVEYRQFKMGQAYYGLAGSNPHDHLIDLDSGLIIEFQNKALDQLKADIAKQHGY